MTMFNVVDSDSDTTVFSGQQRECEIWIGRNGNQWERYLIVAQPRIAKCPPDSDLDLDVEGLNNLDDATWDAIDALPDVAPKGWQSVETSIEADGLAVCPGCGTLHKLDDDCRKCVPLRETNGRLRPIRLPWRERFIRRVVTAYFVARDFIALFAIWFALMVCPIRFAYLSGWSNGRNSVQSANDLLDAGFIMADPEGFEVERFDDGAAEKPLYWTVQPKGGK